MATESYLLVGTVGEILAYTWKTIKSSDAKISWKIDLPDIKDSFDKADVNVLMFHEESEYVYAGCGDSNIYVFNIETRKVVQILKGHSDYIHSIYYWYCSRNVYFILLLTWALNSGNKLISGGEDGLVNIWDIKSKQVAQKIEPHKKAQLSRPDIGNWIGAVAMNEDWLVI